MTDYQSSMSEYGMGYEDGYDGRNADPYMYEYFTAYCEGYQDGCDDREWGRC